MATALVLSMLGVALAAPEMIPETEDQDLIGRTAPDFELSMMDGSTFKLSEHRGKPVVLAFWASWCGPCRLELPALDAYAVEHPDVSIVAVNVDRELKDAEKFLRQVSVDLPVALDAESRVMGNFSVYTMPTTILLDPNGTVKLFKIGYGKEKGLSELDAAINGLK